MEKKKARVTNGQSRTVEASEYSSAYFDGKKIRTGIYKREELSAGMKLRTPCIVKSIRRQPYYRRVWERRLMASEFDCGDRLNL